MIYEEYKKLEDKINNEDFNKSYKTVNLILTVFSYFGHIVSIILAYFMLSQVISGAMTDNTILAGILSVIILAALELIKRSIFDKFSISFLKMRGLTKQVMPLFLLSFFIVSISFYSSIKGAEEFSSKEDVIDDNKKEVLAKYNDSLTNVYNVKISEIESEIKTDKDNINLKDKEQTDLEAIQPPSRSQIRRIEDLKVEKKSLKSDIAKLEGDINSIKQELTTKIKEHEAEIDADTEDKKKDNSSNSLAFILISTLIEFSILAGIFFGEYYKFRSYREFREKIERDPNFQKWMLYDQILSIVYTEDTKMNQKLPSSKGIIDICKINDIIVLNKDVTNFLKTAAGLGIIKVSGNTRYINKQRDLSFETLRKNFNIK